MKRVMIIGCPGSGKTTLSFIMSEKLNIPIIHLDKLFWKPGWVEAPRDEFDAALKKGISADEWIADGNYGRTIDMRLTLADTVIMLDYPTPVCVFRVLKRIFANLGRVRPDMGSACPEKLDWEFLKYVMFFRRLNRPKLLDKLGSAGGKNIIIIRNRRDYSNFLLTLDR